MPDPKEVLRPLIDQALERLGAEQMASKRMSLSVPTWGPEEILEAIDSLLAGQLTMGKKVELFERRFADYVRTPGAVMVNSGSSADLLAMTLLANPETPGHLRPGDEVITPAVTWSTTVFSILAAGLTPVLVDVDPGNLLMDPEEVEKAISDRTGAIFCVHLLGNPCNMEELSTIAQEHDLFLVEDACEAHGARAEGGKMVGSMGDSSTFSFYFSHHMTTIEGGMVTAREGPSLDILRSMRAHGWIRERSDKKDFEKAYPDLDPRFLFANMGFNLRPTEIQGAFGLHQLDKLEGFIRGRRENARFITKHLQAYQHVLMLPEERPGTRHVYFGYPIVVKDNPRFDARTLQKFLEAQGLETRPIMSGNIARHPALRLLPCRQVGKLKNADTVAENGFFFGIHHGVGPEELDRIVGSFESFMASKGVRAG